MREMAVNFCMSCGHPMETREIDGVERRVCTACGHVHWGNYSIGVGALVFKDEKMLLVRRAQEPGKGKWTNPGGYIEQLEPIEQTIVREVLEETGIQAEVKSIVAVRDQPRSVHNVYIAFEMDYVEGEPRPDEVEVDQAGFFSLEEMQEMELASFTRWLLDVALHVDKNGLTIDQKATAAGNGDVYFRL
ncbi:NUDIX hydrolase [Brevibacillus nitrificans]|uniref:NUDIX hydrolase n=1 Tax=Brevibacillus nitrificans TaxID=651560 RepID=UPI002E2200C9